MADDFKTMDVVTVVWLNSWRWLGTVKMEELAKADNLYRTSGFLVERTDEFTSIAQNINGDLIENVYRIPNCSIQSISKA